MYIIFNYVKYRYLFYFILLEFLKLMIVKINVQDNFFFLITYNKYSINYAYSKIYISIICIY